MGDWLGDAGKALGRPGPKERPPKKKDKVARVVARVGAPQDEQRTDWPCWLEVALERKARERERHARQGDSGGTGLQGARETRTAKK